ncbi:MAG: succinate dehydrogenase assembly factor 4 [Gammaproteobacteria bacterium]
MKKNKPTPPLTHSGEKNPVTPAADTTAAAVDDKQAEEFGGPKGPEPTRYGDWERRGRCIDF